MIYQKNIPVEELIYAQFELLLQNSRVSNLTLQLVGVAMAVALMWPIFDQRSLFIWAGCFTALLLLRYVLMGVALRDRTYQSSWKRVFWQMIVGAVLVGAAWSGFYIYVAQSIDIVPQYVLLLIIMIVTAFSSSASVAMREYFLAYVYSTLLPIAWWSLLYTEAQPQNFIIGLGVLGVCAVILFLSNSLHNSLSNMIAVNWERESMARELGDITGSLRDRNKQLKDARRQLTNLANVDELTGLGNRRLVNNMLQEEINRARRSGTELSVILLDVDHFKFYNDTYGHPAGDEVLRRLANIMTKAAARAGEVVARYGGEEFIIILPGAPAGAAFRTASNLKDMVTAAKMPHKTSLVADYITVSQGIATVIPDGDLEPQDLVKRADTALYQAKDSGRNTIIAMG